MHSSVSHRETDRLRQFKKSRRRLSKVDFWLVDVAVAFSTALVLWYTKAETAIAAWIPFAVALVGAVARPVLRFVFYAPHQLYLNAKQDVDFANEDERKARVELEKERAKVAAQAAELTKSNTRLSWLHQRTKGPRIAHEAIPPLAAKLSVLKEVQVVVSYIDDHPSYAGGVALNLADLMRTAGWRVDVYPVQPSAEKQNLYGLYLYANVGHYTQAQDLLLSVLGEAGLSVGVLSGYNPTKGTDVELIVGWF